MRYNTAAIRDLLNQALSDDELNTLVFDHFREIYDNYFTASLTRQQKTQILLEQAERRGETERLLGLVRELNPAQVTAYADQVLRLPPATARRSRPRWLLPLAAGLIVVGIGALLLIRSMRTSSTFKYPQAETPCLPSATPVKLAIRPLTDCAVGVSDALRNDWTSPLAAPVSVSAAADAALRSWSQADGYDLIVSGGCRGSESITLTFDLAAIRNADDLYQPPSVSVGGTLADVTQTGAALIAFQHGDYGAANKKFETLPLAAQTRELELLHGNALLFEGLYQDAIEAYEGLTQQQPNWPFAWHNLGVAHYNEAMEHNTYAASGSESLGRAINLAAAQGAREIELLALVNRANVYGHQGNRQQIPADCQKAEELDSASPLTRVCWLYYYIAIARTDEGKGVPVNALIQEKLGSSAPSDPPRLQVIRGFLYSEVLHVQLKAEAAYTRFLEQMQFHACLKQDRAYLADLR